MVKDEAELKAEAMAASVFLVLWRSGDKAEDKESGRNQAMGGFGRHKIWLSAMWDLC